MQKKLQTAFTPRQYMISKDYEIFYYNDLHFSGVKKHSHNYYEFYFFLEGDVSMEIEDYTYPLHPGDVILIPPGRQHRAISHNEDSPYRRFVFWISRDYMQELAAQSMSYNYLVHLTDITDQYIFHFSILEFSVLQGKIFNLLEEIHSNHFGKDSAVTLYVNELVLSLNRAAYEKEHPVMPHEDHTLYESLLQYIETHLNEDLSLESLAGQFYVSKFHISHLFKEQIGLSVHQYIIKKRLSLTRNAILSGTPINEAYLLYGFKDYSSFYRMFKKEYHMSPKAYKNNFSILS